MTKTLSPNILSFLSDGIPVISFIIPVKGNDRHFILGDGKKISLVDWDGKSAKAELVRTVGEVEFDMANNRWNDAKVDPFGRFYGGTMRLEACGDIFDAALGTFYRYSNNTGFMPLKSKIGVSNGLAWNATTNKFYYIDSCTLDVKEFDYDPKTGGICKTYPHFLLEPLLLTLFF
jgi:gluconolactonase